MYNSFTFIDFLNIVLLIVIVITFFIMSARIKSIDKNLSFISKILANKPENRIKATCPKCGKEIDTSIANKGTYNCPYCKEFIKI